MKLLQFAVALWGLHAVMFVGMVVFDPVHLLLSGAAGASWAQAFAAVLFVQVRLVSLLFGPGLAAAGVLWWASGRGAGRAGVSR